MHLLLRQMPIRGLWRNVHNLQTSYMPQSFRKTKSSSSKTSRGQSYNHWLLSWYDVPYLFPSPPSPSMSLVFLSSQTLGCSRIWNNDLQDGQGKRSPTLHDTHAAYHWDTSPCGPCTSSHRERRSNRQLLFYREQKEWCILHHIYSCDPFFHCWH